MKKIKLITCFVSLTMLSSCIWYTGTDDDDFESFSNYDPVVLERTVFNNSISLTDPIPIVNSGKIYVKDTFLFINEVNKGFHIYDNSNPENPVPLRFLTTPGATDMAIRNNTFYINQARDLIAVSFNAEDNSVTVEKRIENTFPRLQSPEGETQFVNEDMVVVDWKLK